VEPEDAKEELSEGIKDFDEEIPPEANVRCQVRDKQLETVCCRDKLPKVWDD
jgi:hypothetical protein